MNQILTNVDKARSAWGDSMPAWVMTLAEACDQGSQVRAAEVIGYSAATINQVLHRNYLGNYVAVEIAIRGALGRERVRCPSLHEELCDLPMLSCLEIQKRRNPYSGRSHVNERFYGCDTGCPHSLCVIRKSRADGVDPAVVAANFAGMFPKITRNLDGARQAWGAGIPAWVELLATVCDEHTQCGAAGLMNYSSCTVNQVLHNKYKGNLSAVATAVQLAFERVRVECPALLLSGDIPMTQCLETQRIPVVTGRVFHTTRRRPPQCATCPNFRQPEQTPCAT